ncbi:MAG TPA: hypothetical protein VFO60_02015, partial [Candidatus Dormibacteraeota bacterium]|nr:hypothetical protein [Candidatus Dormibacteraeota bacterium]
AASPTLADLDNTGRLSVIISSYSGTVWVWDASGNVRPGWPRSSQHGGYGQAVQKGFFSSVAVGDVFADGRKELFASAIDQYTYGWYSDGTPMPGFPHLVYDSALATPVLADLEHQHHLDIVTPADTYGGDPYGDLRGGTYWTWSPFGGLLWRGHVDEVPWASPAVDNFGDGRATIVNGTGEFWHNTGYPTVGRYIAGFNDDGTVRQGFPSATGAAVFAGPSVGDLLGNGGREIAAVSEDGMIHVVDGSGRPLPGTPTPSLFIPGIGQSPGGFYHGGSIIAPVDIPGRNGLWVQGGPFLYGYDDTGAGLSMKVSILMSGNMFSTPAEAPLGDGTLGIALTSEPSLPVCNQAATWHIALFTLTQAGSSLPGGAWPTFHGNNARSGSNLGLFPPPNHGYWMVASDGGIFPFGNAAGYGSTGGIRLNQPIVGMAKAPRDNGYWLVASDGGIFPFGPGAAGYGSTGGIRLNQPIVGMAATPDGRGYWLVASDGGIFPFGDAGGYGSTGAIRLNKPIVGMAPTASGRGYWLVASDGGIFPFGDAGGYGSTGAVRLNSPIVGMEPTPDGGGYWLVAADGGIFPFGDAGGYGSAGGTRLNAPIVGMALAPGGQGYYLVGSDGGLFSYGPAAQGFGSLGAVRLNRPVVGMAATN